MYLLYSLTKGQTTNNEHLICTSEGSYLARCQDQGQGHGHFLGHHCHCLNVSSGGKIGIPKKVASLDDKLDCGN